MRHILSSALVALIVGSLAGVTVSTLAQEPAQPAPEAVVTAGLNADSVDGKHAVSATSKKSARRNKLVAADAKGLLPSNIVKPKWGLISQKPPAFADGVITWDEVQGKPALGGGPVAWGDIAGIPAGFVDGVDNEGVTGLTIIRRNGSPVNVSPSGTWAYAYCPSGMVVGGGFAAQQGVYVEASGAAGQGMWGAFGRNLSGSTLQLSAYVVCLATDPSSALTAAGKGAPSASIKKALRGRSR